MSGERRQRDAATLARAEAVVHRIVAERHDRPSLVSRIACEIGAEIIENVLLPGDDLNSVELARRYETSRTPIREAIMLLEKEGLVDIPPRRRPRVVSLSLPEIREIYLARAALLELTAVQVVQNASDADIADLRALIERMRLHCRAGDLNQYLWTNIEFQQRNTEVARNRTVKRIIDSLLLRTVRQRRLSLSQPARLETSFNEHASLQDAYEARDPGLAAALIRSNHNNALATLERVLADTAPAAVPGADRQRVHQ
jgi:DNA-binding GntR family transcriptional regulator